jgi:fructose-specific phosphotransferase system IIA component
MRLSDILSEELIIIDFKPKDKWDAIEKLLQVLEKHGKSPTEHHKTILQTVIDREKSVSTGIGEGVAIPHGAVDTVDEIICSFGLVREGMNFEALDGKEVNLIFLLVVPRSQFQNHIKTLATISRLLNNTKFRKKLKACSSAADVIAHIKAGELDFFNA